MSAANGHPSRPWANGVSVPLATPFRADESVDHPALAAQVTRLAKAGVGIVLLGTNGEGESIESAPGIGTRPFRTPTPNPSRQTSCRSRMCSEYAR
jgi:hypothetical protein